MQNYHELPKLRDSMSYLYIEHAIVDKKQKAIEFVQESGRTLIPTSGLSVIMLGPGTSVTHAAVKTLAQSGTSIIWTGQDATRYYANGTGETRKGYRLVQQAHLVSDPSRREQVVLRMYRHRFDVDLPIGLSLPQIRGKEGVRVRMAYAEMSKKYGVPWNGRNYKRGSWGDADPINRAISAANSLLNGICHSAIVSGGYSPGLGFIHTGKQLSFVYDIADLYKVALTLPAAFQTVAESEQNIDKRVRTLCRKRFKEAKLLKRILPDIDALLRLDDEDEDDPAVTIPIEPNGDIDADGALPTKLWSKLEQSDTKNDTKGGDDDGNHGA